MGGHRLSPPCGGALGLASFFRQVFLLDTQKEPKKCPLLPIAREARLKGAWVRAAHERFASAPLRIQERTHWPLPGANTLQLDGSQFLLFVVCFRSFVGGGVLDAPRDCAELRFSVLVRRIVRRRGIARANTVRPYNASKASLV